jgi:two-component system heavy metal sensor histidine kinase CusS
MCWKRAKNSIKNISLRTQLNILHGLSVLAIAGTICLFVYSATFAKMLTPQEIKNPHTFTQTLFAPIHPAVKCFMKTKVALLLTILGTILLTNLIARNMLLKIKEFSDRIENISAHSLSDKLNSEDYTKEFKVLADNFNNMLDRVKNSFVQLSQFSSDIAHELRNPINNLKGLTEITLTRKKSPEEYVQVLEKNMEEFNYLSKLIDNLLFLARSENQELVVKKQTITGHVEVENLLEYFQSAAEEKNIILSSSGEANFFVEPILFKRVIYNLVSNAIKHTPANGKIEIYLQSNSDSTSTVIVKDSGLGIEEKHLSRIFDRFYKVDASRSSNMDGNCGLGLAIVKSIVELHQGEISIESKLQQGTTVHIHFPRSQYAII